MSDRVSLLRSLADACYLSVISDDKMAVNRINVVAAGLNCVGIVPNFAHGFTYFYDVDLLNILQWCKHNLVDVTISVRYNRPIVIFHGYNEQELPLFAGTKKMKHLPTW